MIEKNDREEKLEEIIERKVQERIDKKVEEKVENELRKKKQQNKKKSSNNKMSRREFLKKTSVGAAGLAATGLLPASALNVKTSKEFDVYTTDTSGGTLGKGLSVDTNQNVKIPNGNIDLNNNSLSNVNQINNTDVSKLGNGIENPMQNKLDANNYDIQNIASAVARNLETTNSLTDPSGTQHTSELAETSQLYTDNEAVNAADSQVDNASTSLAGLDNHVAGLTTGVSSVNGQ